MTREESLEAALAVLAEQFKGLNWKYPTLDVEQHAEPVLYWPGDPKEDIMICVLKDQTFREELHRHDFFFFNYAYRCDYEAETIEKGNVTTIKEGECYIGQPFTGYGLRQAAEDPAVVIGVLVQKAMFYREFLPVIASDPAMFRFFLDPRSNAYSEDFMHFPIEEELPVRSLLEAMVMEYANRSEDSQAVLKPLVSALLLYIARCYRKLYLKERSGSASEQFIRYMASHADSVTLTSLSEKFSYHPNYISSLLRKESGRTFTQILTRIRMERAVMLMQGTGLSVEEISAMLGYADRSNFFKAFRSFFGKTPRTYVRSLKSD